jgi:hypothetical protein
MASPALCLLAFRIKRSRRLPELVKDRLMIAAAMPTPVSRTPIKIRLRARGAADHHARLVT